MSDENRPLHEQAYQIVVEGQKAERRRELEWQPGSGEFAAHSSPAAIGGLFGALIAAISIETDGFIEMVLAELFGVLAGAGCGWLIGRALRFVFKTVPVLAIQGLRKLWLARNRRREPPV